MRLDTSGRFVLFTGLFLLAAQGCKKKSGTDTTAAASQSAAAPAAPASIAPAVEPSATAEASAAAAAPAPTPSASAPATTTVKHAVNAGYQSIQRCCNALAAGAKKPGPQHNKYQAAAAVCSGIAAQVKKGAANATSARTTIRAQLQGVPVPGGC